MNRADMNISMARAQAGVGQGSSAKTVPVLAAPIAVDHDKAVSGAETQTQEKGELFLWYRLILYRRLHCSQTYSPSRGGRDSVHSCSCPSCSSHHCSSSHVDTCRYLDSCSAAYHEEEQRKSTLLLLGKEYRLGGNVTSIWHKIYRSRLLCRRKRDL